MGVGGVLTQSSRAQLQTCCHCNTEMAGMEGSQASTHCPQVFSLAGPYCPRLVISSAGPPILSPQGFQTHQTDKRWMKST